MKILIISAILMFFLVMIAMQIIVSTRANTNLNSAYQERFDLMRMAGHVIAAHPLTGVGIGAYEHTFKNYIPPHLQGAWKYTVHNYYLLHTAEKGLVGGLAFIALLLTGLKTAARLTRSRLENVRQIAWGISAGIVALAFEMYWDTWTGFTYNALLWFLLGLLGAAQRIDKESGKGI